LVLQRFTFTTVAENFGKTPVKKTPVVESTEPAAA
jgi:hypothetical protein